MNQKRANRPTKTNNSNKKPPRIKAVREYTAGGVVFRRRATGRVEILMIQDRLGRWTIPKGHVEPGESIEQTAVREVAEETGLTRLRLGDHLDQLHFFYRKDGKLIFMTTHVFLMEALGETDALSQGDSEGIVDAQWFDQDRALKLVEYRDTERLFRLSLEKLDGSRPPGPNAAAGVPRLSKPQLEVVLMNDSPTLDDFQTRLGVKFSDPHLLERAFIHRSYLNEHPKLGLEHNERLEFLGDAVLELVVTDYLYRTFPNPEGDLTNWRSALVKTESLAAVATKLEIASYFKLSRGESKGNARSHALISANAVEAIIGAVYLDQGYDVAAKFIADHVISRLDEILATGTWMDPKSKFQELAQERFGLTPGYRVMEESGPDHDKVFTIGVYVGDKRLGQGTGSSKQAAQQVAAAAALQQLADQPKDT